MGVVGLVGGRWGAPWGTSSSFGVARLIGVRPGGRRVRSG